MKIGLTLKSKIFPFAFFGERFNPIRFLSLLHWISSFFFRRAILLLEICPIFDWPANCYYSDAGFGLSIMNKDFFLLTTRDSIKLVKSNFTEGMDICINLSNDSEHPTWNSGAVYLTFLIEFQNEPPLPLILSQIFSHTGKKTNANIRSLRLK